MKNQKMKKIIFETIAIAIVTLIIVVNVQAETEKNPVEYENNPELPYSYFIIGWGYIGGMKINDQDEKFGKLEGSLDIWNSPGWESPDYKLFIFNKNTNKLLDKKNLPEVFILKDFVGFGYIKEIDIPHGIIATKYFIIGQALDLIE